MRVAHYTDYGVLRIIIRHALASRMRHVASACFER
jgi:hypothetical protein